MLSSINIYFKAQLIHRHAELENLHYFEVVINFIDFLL
jgi:hypothetical protein